MFLHFINVHLTCIQYPPITGCFNMVSGRISLRDITGHFGSRSHLQMALVKSDFGNVRHFLCVVIWGFLVWSFKNRRLSLGLVIDSHDTHLSSFCNFVGVDISTTSTTLHAVHYKRVEDSLLNLDRWVLKIDPRQDLAALMEATTEVSFRQHPNAICRWLREPKCIKYW